MLKQIGASHVTITDRSDSMNQIALLNAKQAVLLNELNNSSSSSQSSIGQGENLFTTASSLSLMTETKPLLQGHKCSVMPLDWGVLNSDSIKQLLAPLGKISTFMNTIQNTSSSCHLSLVFLII